MHWLMLQQQLMQQTQGYPGTSYQDMSQIPYSRPDPTPPLPQRNPARQQTEQDVARAMQDPNYMDALVLEGVSRLGHSPPPYGEGESSATSRLI